MKAKKFQKIIKKQFQELKDECSDWKGSWTSQHNTWGKKKKECHEDISLWNIKYCGKRERSKNFQMGKKDHREGKGIIMASDFSTATPGTRRLGGIIFKMLRENYFQPRILPLAKMSIKRERRIKLNKVSKNSPPVHLSQKAVGWMCLSKMKEQQK